MWSKKDYNKTHHVFSFSWEILTHTHTHKCTHAHTCTRTHTCLFHSPAPRSQQGPHPTHWLSSFSHQERHVAELRQGGQQAHVLRQTLLVHVTALVSIGLCLAATPTSIEGGGVQREVFFWGRAPISAVRCFRVVQIQSEVLRSCVSTALSVEFSTPTPRRQGERDRRGSGRPIVTGGSWIGCYGSQRGNAGGAVGDTRAWRNQNQRSGKPLVCRVIILVQAIIAKVGHSRV